MIVGLQGNDSKYVRVHADAKHFSAFDGPGNGGDAWISDRDWFSTYMPPMRAAAAAKSASFMCSYAQLNGVYACNNHRALTEILRDTWGFDGFVVSDMGALHGAVEGVTAGCDLEDGYVIRLAHALALLDRCTRSQLDYFAQSGIVHWSLQC
jgi:beta-glucosidase-like glycosyl hydrolase